jgi:O-antigen/teichoic acid export membrane protein
MLGKEHWKEIFNFTKYVASNNIMNKVYNDGKSLILGKVLSLIELGVFSITNQVAGFFTRNIQPIITELSAPLLAINSHDKTRIRKNNSDMTIMLMVICFPLFTGLISISDRFCIIYLGEEIGNSVVLPVKITLWGELFRTVLNPSSSIFNIFQRPKIPFKFNLFFVPASLILFIIFGKSWGLVGTCWFFTITNTLSKFYVLGKALSLIDGTLIELTKKMLPTLLGGSIACLLTYFVSTMVVPLPNNSVLGLIITTTIGAVIYYVCFITIARPNLITLLGFVNNIHKKFGAVASKLLFIKVA